jgi:6-pyruvoyltetrahydropterin/6-carboxytetrahydropterin synthase
MMGVSIPKEPYKLRIFREDFGFSAGHILVCQDHIEASHGHSYQVSIEIEGRLNEDFMLVDFRMIKEYLSTICRNLNNRTLAPILNPRIGISQNGQFTKIAFNGKHIELPTDDVLCLQLPNLSSEMIAYYIFKEMHEKLGLIKNEGIKRITIDVIESPGQSASFVGEM